MLVVKGRLSQTDAWNFIKEGGGAFLRREVGIP